MGLSTKGAQSTTNGVKQEEKYASQFSSIINLVNTVIGAGTLGLPFAIAKAGLLPASLMFLFMIIISFISFFQLIYVADATCLYTYGDLAGKVFGVYGILSIAFCTFLKCFGVLWAYIVLAGDFLLAILEACNVPSTSFIMNRWLLTLVMGVGFYVPLSWFRRVASLKYVSSFALVAILYAIVIVFIRFFVSSTPNVPVVHRKGEMIHPSLSIIQCFSTFCFAFGCHQNLPFIQGELQNKSRSKMLFVTAVSFFIVSIGYIMCGYFGYFQFTDLFFVADSPGNILTMYPSNDIAIIIARVGTLITVIFSYPLLLIPARSALFNVLRVMYDMFTCQGSIKEAYANISAVPPLIPPEYQDKKILGPLTKHHLITSAVGTLLALLTTLLSVFLYKVNFVFDIIGSTAGAVVAFVVPPALFIRVVTNPSRYVSRKRRMILHGEIVTYVDESEFQVVTPEDLDGLKEKEANGEKGEGREEEKRENGTRNSEEKNNESSQQASMTSSNELSSQTADKPKGTSKLVRKVTQVQRVQSMRIPRHVMLDTSIPLQPIGEHTSSSGGDVSYVNESEDSPSGDRATSRTGLLSHDDELHTPLLAGSQSSDDSQACPSVRSAHDGVMKVKKITPIKQLVRKTTLAHPSALKYPAAQLGEAGSRNTVAIATGLSAGTSMKTGQDESLKIGKYDVEGLDMTTYQIIDEVDSDVFRLPTPAAEQNGDEYEVLPDDPSEDDLVQKELRQLLVPKKKGSFAVVCAWIVMGLGIFFGMISLAMAIIYDTDLKNKIPI
ncbi:putative AminoAcid/AuxinPermease(AAAP) Family Protein [Monocercomonoides exilis]|uniref:putative AminoAcid/AuxinPermease(AAAP) Family Protein n=1 Tax=Monocercomonoides exilis TaxID=2049356 RepID=UPI0035597BA7|nr:putative AminoAcid/AuxinPermease(AAAP) Family Protein [Monocercomonoides exilis]|eukprot:MONOS_5530.1-p1 / transcript=MONOS_5530.1 / gene=MONOS_5530 / organism=Monocercomonoides_exilis_PA203 / gene_product=AminoAcid/AuxinPermease(AAAP) Family Protein / transcript_product=AminoAcid/AuxinPermease(AAAP) Family Protein / location=Mono_scaffold00162:45987-48571(-) / protein_length=779 / sequence_SO=supercontig / SO=protein_coding / is_pseudo=false